MEAKLPNINAAFIYWRSQSVKAMSLKDYDAAAGSLNNINALFPEEYKVSINTKEYNKLMDERVIYQCRFCKAETNFKEIRIIKVNLSIIDSIIHKTNQINVWVCPNPKCRKENELSDTEIIIEKKMALTEVDGSYPSTLIFLKVVPTFPIKQVGIADRQVFPVKFSNWFYLYLRELEYQLGLYRIEYRAQHGVDMDDDFKDDGKD